jgi:hypothetical chaperone protein
MTDTAVGIDFGTSNSTAGCVTDGQVQLIPLEDGKLTIPSAIFFDYEHDQILFGRRAIAAYKEQREGRLLRSLKSVLGGALMEETTQVKQRRLSFKEIIGAFLAHLKAGAERHLGQPVDRVVLGRPVHFVDGDPAADRRAQEQLEAIARACGFRRIGFQHEPVAAALDYERGVTREEIALIADIGGGTSDFSLIRLSPGRQGAASRRQDVLASTGVHVGGTDLDRRLSLSEVMPHLGYGSRQRARPELELPSPCYFDLATWHKIAFLYNRKTLAGLKDLCAIAAQPALVGRLIHVLQTRSGHRLAEDVESAKIALSREASSRLRLDYVEQGLEMQVSRARFEQAIAPEEQRLRQCIAECLRLAGMAPAGVDTVFLTGGSTFVPAVRRACTASFADARIVEGDQLTSVGTGLAIDAARRLGGPC